MDWTHVAGKNRMDVKDLGWKGVNWYVEIKCQLDATEVFIADLIAC